MDANTTRRQINRALVLCGGGAKGAYTFGCLQAFKERNIRFDAVAGTSVGALNALLWSTNSLDEGKKLWDELSFSTVYPVKFINPKWFNKLFPNWLTKYLLQGLAGVLFFFLSPSKHRERFPFEYTHYTARILTVPCSIPIVINFFILLAVFIFLIFAFISGLFPIENGWWSNLKIIAGLGFLGLFTFSQLSWIKSIYNEFNKGRPKVAVVPVVISSIILIIFLVIVFGIYFAPFFSRSILPISAFFERQTKPFQLFCLTIASALSAIFGIILAKSATVFLKFVFRIPEKVLNKLGTILDSAPLYKTVERILLSKSPSIPTFVTTASLNDVFDPERGEWVPDEMTTPDIYEIPFDHVHIHSYKLEPLKLWIPHYININELTPEDSALYCVASAALPFGIVPSVKINDKDFVDGGVIDNIPFYPFIDILSAEEIYVVLLENFESDEDAQRKSNLTPDDWNEMERLQTVAKFLKPPSREPPKPHKTIVDHKQITRLPKLVFFYPSQSSAKKIGGFVDGTLRFESDYAKDIMQLGKTETLLKLAETKRF